MNEVKRLCPTCGAGNDLERDTCQECGGDFNFPVAAGQRLPATWKQVGTSLALSAAALALRVGTNLAMNYLERKAAQAAERRKDTEKRTQAPRRQEPDVQAVAGQKARVRVWGRRAWGGRRSDGSSQVEVEEFSWQSDGQ